MRSVRFLSYGREQGGLVIVASIKIEQIRKFTGRSNRAYVRIAHYAVSINNNRRRRCVYVEAVDNACAFRIAKHREQ